MAQQGRAMDLLTIMGAQRKFLGLFRSARECASTAARSLRPGMTLLASALLLLVAGCAISTESRQALAGYVEAMSQVEQSANVFLSDFSNAQKVQEELQRVAGGSLRPVPPEYPAELMLAGIAGVPQTEADRHVWATRQALAVVRAYNEALVALAEGRSETEIRQSATELGGQLQTLATLAGATLPGLGLAAAIGPALIKQAQDAANLQQLTQAVLAGREPVRAILDDLEKQTPAMYRLSVVGTSQGQTKLRDDLRRAAAVLKATAGIYGPPTEPELASKMAAIQAQVGDIGQKTRTLAAMPIPLPYANGRRAYDTAAHAQTQVLIQSMATTAEKYAELIAKQNAYHSVLEKYVVLLRQTQSSLDLLAQALSRPVDLRAAASRLLGVAFNLRDAMTAYRNSPATTTSQ
jgi:hypothetical protein